MTNEENEEQLMHIRANAALVIAELGPISGISDFGLNHASVVWVEGYIERQREHGSHDATAISNLVGVFGSYLGECLVEATGGTWQWSEQQQAWSVRFANDAQAFPFVKVRKLFDEGLAGGESIVSFYDISVHYVATGRLGEASGTQDAPPN